MEVIPLWSLRQLKKAMFKKHRSQWKYCEWLKYNQILAHHFIENCHKDTVTPMLLLLLLLLMSSPYKYSCNREVYKNLQEELRILYLRFLSL